MGCTCVITSRSWRNTPRRTLTVIDAASRSPPWKINNRHYNSYQCRLGRDRQHRRETLHQFFEVSQVTIKFHLVPLDSASIFPYLLCIIPYYNIEQEAMYHNLRKAQKMWGMVSRILVKVGVMVRAREIIYKEVLHTVLLYGSESWFITYTMIKMLGRFRHQIAKRAEWKTAQRVV